jgi:hypothetical protein
MISLKHLDRYVPLSLAGALALFLLLWRMDFPKPFFDDLFYVGAGINLASGGDLSNPMLVRQGFASHYFFVYPPLHSYALAGWLKAFGVSAAALTGFQMLAYVVTAAATIGILRQLRGPVWLEWLAPLGVCTALTPLGLRPEPMATALIMAGLVALNRDRAPLAAVCLGFFLTVLGGSAAPRVAPFAIAFSLLQLVRLGKGSDGNQSRRLVTVAIAAVAFVAVLIIFLAQIHFRVGEFWQTFHSHAHERVVGNRLVLAMRFLFGYPDATQLPLLFLLGVFAFLLYPRPWGPPVQIAMAILGGFLLAIYLGLLGHGTVWFGVFAFLVLVIPILEKLPPDRLRFFRMAVAGSLVLANGAIPAQLYGQLRGKIDADPGPARDRAFAMRPAPGHYILVDNPVARYLFDYRLPANFIDLHFGGPDAVDYTAAGIREGDVVLGTDETIGAFRQYGFLRKRTRQWRPLGLPGLSFDAHPRRIYILTASDLEPGEDVEM